MAKLVLRDASIVINGVDLSNLCSSVEISTQAADVEVTAMGAAGVQRLPGLRDESISVTWRQDYAAGKVDATLWPLYSGGTAFTVDVKPTSAAASATNPKYTGTCYLLEYQPIAGDVGDVASADTTFVVDGALTRATS